MSEAPGPSPNRVPVWDVPVRLAHWLIVLLFAGAWWTARNGYLDWHQYCGYGLLALVSFRIYWGFFGSSTARFSQFVRGPRAILGYLQGKWVAVPGHNPLGALSVIALFALLLTQIVLGLFAVDIDGIESGPLSVYVSFNGGRAAADWHHELFEVLKWLVALHVAAVLYYVLYKKENLIGAMLHGNRDHANKPSPLVPVSPLRLLAGIALAIALTILVARGFR